MASDFKPGCDNGSQIPPSAKPMTIKYLNPLEACPPSAKKPRTKRNQTHSTSAQTLYRSFCRTDGHKKLSFSLNDVVLVNVEEVEEFGRIEGIKEGEDITAEDVLRKVDVRTEEEFAKIRAPSNETYFYSGRMLNYSTRRITIETGYGPSPTKSTLTINDEDLATATTASGGRQNRRQAQRKTTLKTQTMSDEEEEEDDKENQPMPTPRVTRRSAASQTPKARPSKNKSEEKPSGAASKPRRKCATPAAQPAKKSEDVEEEEEETTTTNSSRGKRPATRSQTPKTKPAGRQASTRQSAKKSVACKILIAIGLSLPCISQWEPDSESEDKTEEGASDSGDDFVAVTKAASSKGKRLTTRSQTPKTKSAARQASVRKSARKKTMKEPESEVEDESAEETGESENEDGDEEDEETTTKPRSRGKRQPPKSKTPKRKPAARQASVRKSGRKRKREPDSEAEDETQELMFISPSQSKYDLIRRNLHASVEPKHLPCREDEYAEIYGTLQSAISTKEGCCIYIAGMPGTGKTATVHRVVRALQEEVEREELDSFQYHEINGMKLTEPAQSYSLLWLALTDEKVTANHANKLLEKRFSTNSKKRELCVLVIDELDMLITKNHQVLYNFFDWPNRPNSRFIVVAIANTMDLPERVLHNRVSSRI
ncbi:Origin recognition complex, subunit 1, partial [Quaeritorhiza haematococci]